jgi:N-acetylmuramoyl-L-alanine amidase
MTGPDDRGFFDLEPEEVSEFKPASSVVARRQPLNWKPALAASAALVVLAAVITAVVLLWPSSGSEVPDLVGKTLTEAFETARDSGFVPNVTGWEFSDVHSDGVVLAQSPRAGGVKGKGGGIELTISKGPQPTVDDVNGPAASSQPGDDQAGAGPFADKTITIDAGSQALPTREEWSDPGMTRRLPGDSGAKGVLTGNDEYLVTLDTAIKLKNLLEKDGIRVVMTRESSTIDLPEVMRAEIAANAESDLYLRIHCGNSSDPAMMGIETLYPARDRWTEKFYEKSKTAALLIQAQLVKSCALDDLGTQHRSDMPGFNWSKVPVVEAEIGFLTNPRDDSLLADEQFRWKVAWGLRNGIVEFLNNS